MTGKEACEYCNSVFKTQKSYDEQGTYAEYPEIVVDFKYKNRHLVGYLRKSGFSGYNWEIKKRVGHWEIGGDTAQWIKLDRTNSVRLKFRFNHNTA
jgi:hypothetical protein